nr:hypothetical protein [Mycoplasmopsis bovis]
MAKIFEIENAWWHQIRLIDNFAKNFRQFKHKISIIKWDEQIKYD